MDGYSRFMLTIAAAALVALVALELGWLPRGGARADAEPPAGRWQFSAARYGPLGNFLVRFDTATGRLERVRFPANDVVWQEVGVVPAGKAPTADPLRATAPQQNITLPPGILQDVQPAPAPPAPPGAGTP
jgi:nitroreductase